MKNKLVVIQLEPEQYICYEIDKTNYQYFQFNYNNIIPFIVRKIKNCNLYLQDFSRADKEWLQEDIYKYCIKNNINTNILNKFYCFMIDSNISIPDYITKKKLKPKNNKKRVLIIKDDEINIIYEFDNYNYSIKYVNDNKLVPIIAGKMKDSYIFFNNVSRAELASIIMEIKEYYINNNLNIDIFNKSVFIITNQNNLIEDIKNNRKYSTGNKYNKSKRVKLK